MMSELLAIKSKVDNAFTAGVDPVRTREKIYMGNVATPAPEQKNEKTKSSSEITNTKRPALHIAGMSNGNTIL